jgi:hypothetical protein
MFFMKKIVFCFLMMFGVAFFMTSAQAQTTYGSAFKYGIADVGYLLDHTYFCLDGTKDCYAIIGSGIQSGSTGGSRLSETYGPVVAGERCASRFRASNSGTSPCYINYAITGVCHQQTNRGLASFGKRMNHNNLKGGWMSLTLYGYYGSGWDNCRTKSNSACGRPLTSR